MRKLKGLLQKQKSSQFVIILAGILMITAGLLAYQTGLSASRGFSGGKALLVVFGAVIVLVGFLGRRIVDVYKVIAVLLLNTILLFVAIEFLLFVGSRVTGFLSVSPRVVEERDLRYIDRGRENLPYYKNQDWSKDYWREYHEAWDNRTRYYSPFVVWRNKAFKGKVLNIDENGLRVTPGSDCRPGAYKVFTFGGSTMWGTGVPDWGTVPAFLQSALAESMDRPVCVVNYSEQGWVSTQSVIQLLLALRSGNLPDLVIFYEGNNDVFAAYQSGTAGVPQNLSSIAARFEDRQEVSPLAALVSKTKTYRILQKLPGRENNKLTDPPAKQGKDVETLSDNIIRVYMGNYQIVEELATKYRFKSFFFWQTMLLIDEKPLTTEEQSIKAVAKDVYPGFISLYDASNARIKKEAFRHSNLFDISDVFKLRKELVFIDPFHVTVEGNRLIASAMMKKIGTKENNIHP